MTLPPRMTCWSAALACLAALSPAPALACVGLGCMDPWWVAPADGGQVPGNAPALAMKSAGGLDPEALHDAGTASALGIELLQADGGAIVLVPSVDEASALVLRPTTPMPAGELMRLRFPAMCSYRAPDAGPYEVSFTTTEAQPLPTTLGTFAVKAQGHGSVEVTESTMCVGTLEAAYAQFAYVPSAEVVPWLPLMRWTLTVNGQRWANEELGMMHANGLLGAAPHYPSQYQVSRRVLQVHSACFAGDETMDRGVGLGVYTAVLEGQVVGTDQKLSLTTSFELKCAGASQPPTPIEDGTLTPLPVPAGCGCTSSPAPVGLALLALVARRWKRR